MTKIPYELALELKERGFPQQSRGGAWFTNGSQVLAGQLSNIKPGDIIKSEEDAALVYSPTTDELIDELGERFDMLFQHAQNEWSADADNDEYEGKGETPAIALSNLYIALHPKITKGVDENKV